MKQKEQFDKQCSTCMDEERTNLSKDGFNILVIGKCSKFKIVYTYFSTNDDSFFPKFSYICQCLKGFLARNNSRPKTQSDNTKTHKSVYFSLSFFAKKKKERKSFTHSDIFNITE